MYDEHRGQFSLSRWPLGDPDKLSPAQQALVDEVIETYGERSAAWLSQLSHSEDPWRKARGAIPDNVRSSAIIEPDEMQRYYRAAEQSGDAPAAVTAAD